MGLANIFLLYCVAIWLKERRWSLEFDGLGFRSCLCYALGQGKLKSQWLNTVKLYYIQVK